MECQHRFCGNNFRNGEGWNASYCSRDCCDAAYQEYLEEGNPPRELASIPLNYLRGELIEDPRLTPTMKRVRSGPRQTFTEGGVSIELEHRRKEMYAELIGGAWYWVSGCSQCNGEERSWKTYIECEEHDVCRSCSKKRKHVAGEIWGGASGWICGTCRDREKAEEKAEAFRRLGGKEPDCSYTDDAICPHCGSELPTDDVYESTETDCEVCGGELYLEVEYVKVYSTRIKGERVLPG